MSSDLTIHTYADVSTRHVTKNDCDLLYDGVWPLTSAYYDTGYFLALPGDDLLDGTIQELQDCGFSDAFCHLVRTACEAGCYVLRLDGDAPKVDGLPTFDW